jgi:hypothetical protein
MDERLKTTRTKHRFLDLTLVNNKEGSKMPRKKTTLLVITLALGLVLAVSGCGPRSEAASPEPDRIVESFYGWYLDYPGNAIVDGAYRSSDYLSQEFVEEVDRIIASFDKGGYDPFLCAQDVPGRTTFDEAVISGDEASVVVRQVWNPGTQPESSTELTVVLQKSGEPWKIHDILCSAPDALAPVTELPQATSPEEAVQSFYDWYLASSAYVENTGERLNPLADGRYASSPYLTEGLIQKVEAIVAAFDKGGYDPFLCAQDVPESFSLGELVVSGEIARVAVRTSLEGHAFSVALLREAGGWKMSDVLCEVNEAVEPSSEGWQTFADDDYGFVLRYPADWSYEEAELQPPEETPDAEKALKRLLFFQPDDWNGAAPPLHVQVTEGNDEAYAKLHVPPDLTEVLSIGDQKVVREVEGLGSDLEVIRYVIPSPANPNLRIVALDYISGFPERAEGNLDVVEILIQVLHSFQFVK